MPRSQHQSTYREVPAFLRELREAAGLSQQALADKLGRRWQTWVAKSEMGERRVDVGEFVAWCLACGTDPATAINRLVVKRGRR